MKDRIFLDTNILLYAKLERIIEKEFELHTVNAAIIKKAIEIKAKYKFSFWDV